MSMSIDPDVLCNEDGVKDLTPKAKRLFAKALSIENKTGRTTKIANRALEMAVAAAEKGE